MKEVNYLKNFEKKKVKATLERMKALVKYLDNPQKDLDFIHIAGTNGKGSTAAILTSIYKQAGYKVATFTSPGIVSLNERIRINDKYISDKELAKLVKKVKPYIKKVSLQLEKPTFFEIITLIAFLYFKENEVDLVIFETGLGGRLDATNVVNSLVSVITNVSLDHTEYLGNSIEEITKEKAGIIKENQKVITATQNNKVLKIIKEKANEKKCKLINIHEEFFWQKYNSNYNYQRFRVESPKNNYNIQLSLLGEYQIINTLTALGVIESLEEVFPIKKQEVIDSLKKVNWPGRLEIVNVNPVVILDGSHNQKGAKILKKELNKFKYRKLILLLSILENKDIKGIIKELVPEADKLILTKNSNKKVAGIEKLEKYTSKYQIDKIKLEDSINAVNLALNISKKEDLILITGSLYTVAELRNYLNKLNI
ncbi:MAG: bifunctional folylpolyglutamate synthase/dihydrofolate synthase [Bacillota bacterium]